MSHSSSKKTKLTQQQEANKQISPQKTLIEQLFDKGWLEYKSSKYSSDARLRAGLKLMFNHQIIKRANLHSGYIVNNRIDISSSLSSRLYSDAVNYYRQALRAIPAEFWPIVRLICIDEKLPVISQQLSERKQAHLNYLYRIDLCRGLDRLISIQLKIDN